MGLPPSWQSDLGPGAGDREPARSLQEEAVLEGEWGGVGTGAQQLTWLSGGSELPGTQQALSKGLSATLPMPLVKEPLGHRRGQ